MKKRTLVLVLFSIILIVLVLGLMFIPSEEKKINENITKETDFKIEPESKILKKEFEEVLDIKLPKGDFSEEGLHGSAFYGEDGIIIDKKILDVLRDEDFMEVSIILKREIDITKREEIINSLLNSLKPTEFILDDTGNGWFSGNITKDGLNKIIQNPNVAGIRISEPLKGF